jgi:hypothetical protein
MANLPSSLSLSASSFGNIPAMSAPQSPSPAGVASGGGVGGQVTKEKKMAGAEQLVLDLCDPDLRENALLDLSKVSLSLSLSPTPPDTTTCCSIERTGFKFNPTTAILGIPCFGTVIS